MTTFRVLENGRPRYLQNGSTLREVLAAPAPVPPRVGVRVLEGSQPRYLENGVTRSLEK